MQNVLRYLGICEEISFAESPAPAAIIHMDIASASLDVPGDTEMIYGGGLSRGPHIHRPGFYAPSGDIVYAFDIRTIGFLLKWALGGYSFATGSPLNTHTIYGSSKNILDSFCARVGKDLFEHVFSGCVINTLTLKVEGAYCELTASIMAAKDAKATLKALADLLLPTEYPLAFHEVTAKIATVDQSAKIKSLNIEISNNLSIESGKTIGSRYPRLIRAGERTVTVSKTLMFDETDELERYWGGASEPSILGGTEFALEINFSAGVDGSLKIDLPRFIYTAMGQKPSGRDEQEQTTSGRAFLPEEIVEETDTDIVATLQNKEDSMELGS